MQKKYVAIPVNSSIHEYWDFMRWSKLALNTSCLLVTIFIIVISIRGFNWGLDFTGGLSVEIELEKSINIDQIREILKKNGFKNLQLQNFNSSHTVVIRTPSLTYENNKQNLAIKIANIIDKNSDQHTIIKNTNFIGPSISNDLIQNGIIAILVALIFIFVYIKSRLEWRIAFSILITLIHDLILTTGLLSLLNIEVNLNIITSLMSVIGYSLNNSIIIFDRIRENFFKIKQRNLTYHIFNISLTQTLRRTLISSGITFMLILVLYLFAGSVLEYFSLTILIGISIGTISSIYLAPALALKFNLRFELLAPKKTKNKIIN